MKDKSGRLITASMREYRNAPPNPIEIGFSVVRDVPIRLVSRVVATLVRADSVLPSGVSFAVTHELQDPARRRIYMTMEAFSKLKNDANFDPTYLEGEE